MEIVRKMNVPVEFFYKTIIDSVLSDIHSQTGKKVSEKQLTGFEYVKTFSKNSKATVRIEEVTKNNSYQYRTTSNKNNFLVAYKIRPLTEESCQLHYTEKMESFGYLQKLNDAFIGIVWSPLKKRRFKEMLKQIEASYLNGAKKSG
ncbi:DUF3284 domain-containing protein [Virgibacillus dakarensis]|uniref:DUF3284 domain-containing protein n=1 Tax=Virgibacillus dakarensis TaxID=1917889 RepID=UPI000B4441AB|nr:DUF3284 domain-containing protein [Virgibacillus dakarensis]MBT2217207.1 DUF3284 domain-containing protein [Virgibacillus dakarensis]MTW85791.1 DUF3284 domain-containing protein [Virgibacillus dakarensis]